MPSKPLSRCSMQRRPTEDLALRAAKFSKSPQSQSVACRPSAKSCNGARAYRNSHPSVIAPLWPQSRAAAHDDCRRQFIDGDLQHISLSAPGLLVGVGPGPQSRHISSVATGPAPIRGEIAHRAASRHLMVRNVCGRFRSSRLTGGWCNLRPLVPTMTGSAPDAKEIGR